MPDLRLYINRFFNILNKRGKSICFLLGAGFSAPMGYPIGSQLNNSLINCKGDDFSFSTDGRLAVSTDGGKPDIGYKTFDDFEFDFCRDLMLNFNKERGYFDYEEFYDYFNYEAVEDEALIAQYDSSKYGTERDLGQMLFAIKKIYSQLVNHFLVDGEGNSWYDNAGHMSGPSWSGYTGILNCIRDLKDGYILNVHTLNHDLFFERLNSSDWINGELCDGFQELDSPFYGKLSVKGRDYMCRLQRYTELYDKKVRLYKLHGSKDYGIYYRSKDSMKIPDTYIKTRYGIGFGELYKEVSWINPTYDYCWINYHADFLTGTTSKIERYEEPLLFKKLFRYFSKNLERAEKLVIVGYGGRDTEINNILQRHFDLKKKPCYIIDPYVGHDIEALANKLDATIVPKQLEDVLIDDIT